MGKAKSGDTVLDSIAIDRWKADILIRTEHEGTMVQDEASRVAPKA